MAQAHKYKIATPLPGPAFRIAWRPARVVRVRSARERAPTSTNRNLAALLPALAAVHGRRPAVAAIGGARLSYDRLSLFATGLATRLVANGVVAGDRVALLAQPGPDWVVGFFGILHAGAVAVPVDSGQPLAETERLIIHSGAGRLLHSGELSESARALASATGVEPFWIERHGYTVQPADRRSRPVLRSADDPALISYTSGTTGRPKGVTVSHGALRAQVRALRAVMGTDHRTRVVSLLPPSHLFELTCGTLAVLAGGGSAVRATTPTAQGVIDAMAATRPRTMVVVPLFLSALRAGIEREVRAQSGLRGRSVRVLLHIARRRRSPRVSRMLCWPLLRRFGGRLEYFVCGGAPLDPEVAAFFDGLGVPVLQGYGLTEASPVVATNRPDDNRPGSVGRPLPETAVAIAPDREILVRGPQVMLGYHRDPAATAAVVDAAGWLHTGDLGRLDDDGYLYVEGRRSNRIVLACGEKVQPEAVETAILRSPLIAECGVLGRPSRLPLHRGSEEVWAVVVPVENGSAAAIDQEALRLEVSRCCADLAAYKRPTQVILRRSPLPATATRKLRRPALHAWLDEHPETAA